MIKKFFNQDSILVGIVAALGSEVVGGAIIWAVLTFMEKPIIEHVKWFAIAFVPTLFVMRYYMKKKEYLLTTKSVITTMFVTFLAFMFIMLRTNINV